MKFQPLTPNAERVNVHRLSNDRALHSLKKGFNLHETLYFILQSLMSRSIVYSYILKYRNWSITFIQEKKATLFLSKWLPREDGGPWLHVATMCLLTY